MLYRNGASLSVVNCVIHKLGGSSHRLAFFFVVVGARRLSVAATPYVPSISLFSREQRAFVKVGTMVRKRDRI